METTASAGERQQWYLRLGAVVRTSEQTTFKLGHEQSPLGLGHPGPSPSGVPSGG